MIASLIVSISAVLIAYPTFSAIRNVYFHPLSKFPGPKIWAASWFPYIYALLTAKLVQRYSEMHEKYGEVTRVGPNEISFATEDAWKDIYEHRPGHKEAVKDERWYIAPNDAPQNIVTTKDTKVRARMRKYLGNSFTEAALLSQSPLIEGHCDVLIAKLKSIASRFPEDGGIADMTDWVNFFTVDVISDLAFGEAFGCLKDSGYHPWVRTLYTFLQGMVFAAAARFYPSTEVLMQLAIPKSVLENQRKHTEFANKKVEERIASGSERPDFMTPFLKADPDFQHMSKGEIQSTFAVAIVAGSETSATVICGILNQLTAQPEILHKLEKIIRSHFEHESDLTVANTTNIPYLEAVIHEALRFCNPVPGGLPRLVPSGGEIYAGHFIPGGTHISIRPFIVGRSEKYFHRGSEYIPERWLAEPPAEFRDDHLGATKPFSTGPTGCIGKPLAWAEMRLVVARLLWAFDLSVDPGKALDWSKLKAMMTIEKQSMPLRLKQRSM